jgi:hypothetical protein
MRTRSDREKEERKKDTGIQVKLTQITPVLCDLTSEGFNIPFDTACGPRIQNVP